MDKAQPFEPEDARGDEVEEDAAIERPPEIGNDERRMHVRAYNYWASLLRDRAYPAIEDLDPASIEDFGPNSVLLDFSHGTEDPVIAWLGPELREECEVGESIGSVSGVPPRSLLSRLTDHYMQIIANQAPIGFEAEFENSRGVNTLYRGILMPFSSDDDAIDFIYGVINWKEIADHEIEAALQVEFTRSLDSRKEEPVPAAPVWEDGPRDFPDGKTETDEPLSGGPLVADFAETLSEPENLADHLVVARESAEEAKSADQRSRAALYEALGRAYDFALSADDQPEDYAELLEDAGIARQERAPMTPIVKLVFGTDYDKTRLTEFAAALSYAKRENIARGTFGEHLARQKGGLKAIVAAERTMRRPDGKPDKTEDAYAQFRDAEPVAYVEIDNAVEGEEFTLLIARRLPDGRLAILGEVPHDKSLADRAIRKAAR